MKKIKSILIAPVERLKDSWIEYSHALYVLLVIAGLFFHNIQQKTDFQAQVVLFAVLFYFVILLFFLGYFIHAYARKARYAEAICCIHDSIHSIRDTTAYLKKCYLHQERYELSKFIQSLQNTIDPVAMAFTLVTGTKCRVAIKILGGGNEQALYVKTLCRDSQSTKNCNNKDIQEGQQHLVSKNTDYNLILHNGRNIFLHNSLNDDPNYMNTSRNNNNEKLPYSAAIVLPIRLVVHDNINKEPRQKVMGFLAIDSSSRNTFTEKYDVQMGATVADALFPVIDVWSRVHDRYFSEMKAQEVTTPC
jgi:hypothetical protein